MANNCLVTKLKGVVDNDMLVHLGNAKIEISNPSVDNCGISGANGQITAVIKTDHVFTDITYTQDLGKTITIEPGARTVLRFKGSSSPAIFEIGPIKNIYQLEGEYPLGESSYGYNGLQRIMYCTYIGSIAKVGTLFENLKVFRPTGAEGNITDLISATKLIAASFHTGNNNVIGRYEDFLVLKYQQGLVDHFSLESNSVTFHDKTYAQELYAGFSQTSPYITVRHGGTQGTIVGTWDGTSWTYTE